LRQVGARRKLELARLEGRQASSPTTGPPKPAGVAGKPASSAEAASSLRRNNDRKRVRPRSERPRCQRGEAQRQGKL
jgi:hypothetical protein